jgi:hypothetical protein
MKIEVQLPARVKARRLVKNEPLIMAMLTSTPEEIESWIDTHINTTADAIVVLKKLVLLCWYMARALQELFKEEGIW